MTAGGSDEITPSSGTGLLAVQRMALSTALRRSSISQMACLCPPMKPKPRPPSSRCQAQAHSGSPGLPGNGRIGTKPGWSDSSRSGVLYSSSGIANGFKPRQIGCAACLDQSWTRSGSPIGRGGFS